ncbi:MAG: hypothetical protein ACRCV6_06815 [Formosimonas sp.]
MRWFWVLCLSVCVSGCAVVSVAGAAVSVASTAVKTTVKVAGAAVDLAIPDKKETTLPVAP